MRIPSKGEYQAACEARDEARGLLDAFNHDADNPEVHRRFERLVPCGLYEHFKSSGDAQKFYISLGVSVGLSGHPVIVEYFALYRPHAGELPNRLIVKDDGDGFLDPINRDEFRGARFKLVKKLSWIEAAKYRTHAKRLAGNKSREHLLAAFAKIR